MEIQCFYELDRNPITDLKLRLGENFEKVSDFLAKREIYREEGEFFYLKYVGLISLEEIIIPVLPKFLKYKNTSPIKAIDSLKLTINTLKKYDSSSEEDIFNFSSLDSPESLNSKLALIDFLLKDFMEYGLYENHIETYELNGSGEIDWENTIENQQAHYIKGKPFYLDLWTVDTVSNEENYIRRLHQFILNCCIEYASNLEIQKLLNLIEIPNINFSVNDEELGDTDFMIAMIEKQLKNEFTDRSILLLKKMKNFLKEKYKNSSEGINLWGTKTFWSIWEEICKYIFRDEYNIYQNKIPYPTWNSWYPSKENKASYTSIPDTLRKVDNNFFIFDAKYYNFYFDDLGNLKGSQPGVGDVTKQFAYEMAFKSEFENIYNFFAIPTVTETKVIGEVKFNTFKDLNPIKILSLNYEEVFKMYINDLSYDKTFFYNLIKESSL